MKPNVKIYLIATVVLLSTSIVEALDISVVNTQTVINTGGYTAPTLSPDNTKIVVTGNEHYRGLYTMNIDGTGIQKLTDDLSAGYKYEWSPDGKSVLFRSMIINSNRDTFYTIKTAEISTGKLTQVSKYEIDVYPPEWVSQGTNIAYVQSGTGVTVDLGKKIQSKTIPSGEKLFFTDNNEVWMVLPSGKKQKLADGYNPELSPDKTRVVYQRIDDIIVNDLLTNKETVLDSGSWPKWSPDSKLIIFAKTADDGVNITDSDLYVADTNSKEVKKLTNTENIVECEPSWSLDGKKIIYSDSNTGNIYLSDLLIKEKVIK
ncbi:MAG: hypothetical protein WC955_04100 [Elusimicrobiota bacterium]